MKSAIKVPSSSFSFKTHKQRKIIDNTGDREKQIPVGSMVLQEEQTRPTSGGVAYTSTITVVSSLSPRYVPNSCNYR
ncbi:hypothetical protein M8C21_014402 [Ambrosia artemisiifolia]|uniref:Uncharacterized protein n=1 Tax=Ambrosia artemisiifolia TaxID=4212 RepID=A0AAD5GKD6_AMBAR|nr:hypothetical protein M8C21_014402 [Ambrosia artemisiifolia]